MPVLRQSVKEDVNGSKWTATTFDTTPRMPTYLAAFALCDFDQVNRTERGKEPPLGSVSRASLELFEQPFGEVSTESCTLSSFLKAAGFWRALRMTLKKGRSLSPLQPFGEVSTESCTLSSFLKAAGFWLGTEEERTGRLLQQHLDTSAQIRIWARKDAIANGDADYALNAAGPIFSFLEDLLNISYPLPKTDIIALPYFDNHAMENWGLMIFDESVLLLQPNDRLTEKRTMISFIVSHEIIHQACEVFPEMQVSEADHDWVILNLNMTGYYRVNYDKLGWKKLSQQLEKDPKAIPVIHRLQLIDDAFSLSKYLEYAITTFPFTFNETNVIEAVAESELGRYVAKDFLVNNWRAVSERYGAQSLVTLMYIIGRAVTTDLQISELQQFFSDMLEEHQKIAVQAKLQTMKNENLKNKKQISRIAEWLRKNT
ncbi:Aminopeptidase Q [Tupaia chinensis]|uniref:Aminopeptidase Q n=1 Tax=Tupaia chinensis TaxID=246437 RepID=L9JCR9_TUPCH|nr:Aminopeptidase Q [Tupaia chinensis]